MAGMTLALVLVKLYSIAGKVNVVNVAWMTAVAMAEGAVLVKIADVVVLVTTLVGCCFRVVDKRIIL